jgi:hypothetical protein
MPIDTRTDQVTKFTPPLGISIELLRPTELRGRYRIAQANKDLPALASGAEFHLARLPIDALLSWNSFVYSTAAQPALAIKLRLAPSVPGEALTSSEVASSEGGPDITILTTGALAANTRLNLDGLPTKTFREIIQEVFPILERADRRFSRSDVDLVAVLSGAGSEGTFTSELTYVVD